MSDTQTQTAMQELKLAEDFYNEALVKLQNAQEYMFKAQLDCFVSNAFDPKSDEDKQTAKSLLRELADKESPFGCYVRQEGQLRVVIDAIAKLFELKDQSDDKYVTIFKLAVTNDNNDVYGITMTYQSDEETTIESKLVEF